MQPYVEVRVLTCGPMGIGWVTLCLGVVPVDVNTLPAVLLLVDLGDTPLAPVEEGRGEWAGT